MKAFILPVMTAVAVALTACGGGTAPAASSHAAVAATVPTAHATDSMDMSDMDMPGMDMSGTSSKHTAAVQPAVHGFKLNVPLPRPEFTLTDTHGHPYDFAARTRGRVTLLYFGYTQCPYQCPTTMADVGIALRKLSPAVRKKVTVVFVTTDAKRDTPKALGRWLANFDSHFVGLTGSQAALDAAQRAARVTVSVPKPGEPAPATGSTAHGGGLLAYGRDDYAHVTYPAGTSSSDLIRDLPHLTHRAPGH